MLFDITFRGASRPGERLRGFRASDSLFCVERRFVRRRLSQFKLLVA